MKNQTPILSMQNFNLCSVGQNRSKYRKFDLPKGIRQEANRYRPQICENGKVRGLGSFETLEGAEIAQLKARINRDKSYIKAAQLVVSQMEERLALLESEQVAA